MKKKNGDWTIKATKKIFGNDFFKVFEDEVIHPDGKSGKYATIHFPPGVSVLPVDDEGNVYLTRQFRYALGRKNLEAIAGGVEDEGVLEAARRESREELGIEADEWTYLGRVESDTGITTSKCHLYLARKLTFHKANSEGTEDIERIKMTLGEAVEKILNNEITHGQTCALVLKAEKLIKLKGEN